jgi:hypothetical protein
MNRELAFAVVSILLALVWLRLDGLLSGIRSELKEISEKLDGLESTYRDFNRPDTEKQIHNEPTSHFRTAAKSGIAS